MLEVKATSCDIVHDPYGGTSIEFDFAILQSNLSGKSDLIELQKYYINRDYRNLFRFLSEKIANDRT